MSKYAQQLVSSVPPQDTVKHWTQARWTESGASTTTRLHKFLPIPSNRGHGVGLSRRAWPQLNRLRTGVDILGQTCCARDWLQATVVIVVPNQRQTTSLVDVVPFTARLRRSMAQLIWTMRHEHGSRTML